MQPQNPIVTYQPTPSTVYTHQFAPAVVTIQQTVPVVTSTTQQYRGGCCNGGSLKCLGVTEIVFGILILLVGIAAVVLTPEVPEGVARLARSLISIYPAMKAAPGIWCGIFLIMTGILGVVIQDDSSKILHIANMAMAIIACLVTMSAMLVASLAIVVVLLHFGKSAAAMHGITIALSLAAFIITIIHACNSCGGRQRQPVTQRQTVYTQQHQAPPVAMTYPSYSGQYGPANAQQVCNQGF